MIRLKDIEKRSAIIYRKAELIFYGGMISSKTIESN